MRRRRRRRQRRCFRRPSEAEAVAQSDVVEWLFLSKARRIIYAGQVSRTKSVSDHPRGQRSACLPACLPRGFCAAACITPAILALQYLLP